VKFKKKDPRQQKTEERISAINSMPNFLSVVEIKNDKDKEFLENLLSPKHEEKYDLKEDGNVFVYKEGKIVDITTIGELCEKKAKEIRDGVV